LISWLGILLHLSNIHFPANLGEQKLKNANSSRITKITKFFVKKITRENKNGLKTQILKKLKFLIYLFIDFT